MEDEGLTQTWLPGNKESENHLCHKVAGLKTIAVRAHIHRHILSPETTWSGPSCLKGQNNSGLMLGLLSNQSTLIFILKNNTTMIVYNKKGGAGRDQGEKIK